MLSDLWRAIVEFIGYLWPFVIVHRWERGIYLVLGDVVQAPRFIGFRVGADRNELPRNVLPAGVYLRLPFFTDVHEVSVAWDFAETDQIDVTLRDGRTFSCVAVAQIRVVDPIIAYCDFFDYEVDRRRMLTAAISELLQEAEPERFEPERRGRLLGSSLLKHVQKQAASMGHEVAQVQITRLILNPRALRLLSG